MLVCKGCDSSPQSRGTKGQMTRRNDTSTNMKTTVPRRTRSYKHIVGKMQYIRENVRATQKYEKNDGKIVRYMVRGPEEAEKAKWWEAPRVDIPNKSGEDKGRGFGARQGPASVRGILVTVFHCELRIYGMHSSRYA